jgi:hypothetical protein
MHIRLIASNIRRERTGTHLKLTIAMDSRILAWSELNGDRDEDRLRLTNAAYKNLGQAENEILSTLKPVTSLKHDVDIFCHEVWGAWVSGDVAGEVVGIEPTEQSCWLQPYVQMGGGTILFGPPGRGKSYTTMLMSVAIQHGLNGLWHTRQAKVLYINLERSEQSMVHRLWCVNKALGLEPTTPLLMLNARGRSLSDVAPAVEATVARDDVQVVALDSISRAGMGDLNENKAGNSTIDILNEIAPSWLAIGHTPRADENHLFGSQMFDAGADIMVKLISVASDEALGIGLVVTKANDQRIPKMQMLAYDFDELGLTGVREAAKSEFPALTPKATPNERIVTYILDNGPQSAPDLAAALEMNRGDVSTALNHSGMFQKLPGRDGSRKTFFGVKNEAR